MRESGHGKMARTTAGKWRLGILVSILVVLVVAGIWHWGIVWHYEGQLYDLAVQKIDEENAADTTPMSEMGPEAWVEISTTVAYDHLFYGEKQGKITLTIHPYPHAPVHTLGGISYTYTHRNGVWEEGDSYHEEF